MKRFVVLVASLALAAISVGCSDSNTNAGNANMVNRNAVVVNTNTTANANTANTNTKRAPTKEEVEKERARYEKEAKDKNRKVGTGTSDLWLWVKTRYELAAADDLKDSTIDVDVENGVVTLSGTVANQEQVKKADAVAKAVEGVKSVQNKLKAAPASANANKTANTKK